MSVSGFLVTGRVEAFLGNTALAESEDTLVVANTEVYDNSIEASLNTEKLEKQKSPSSKDRPLHENNPESIDLLESVKTPSWPTTVEDGQSWHRSDYHSEVIPDTEVYNPLPERIPSVKQTFPQPTDPASGEYSLKFRLKLDGNEITPILHELPYERSTVPDTVVKMYETLNEAVSYDPVIDVAIVIVPESDSLVNHSLEVNFAPWLCRSVDVKAVLVTNRNMTDEKYKLLVLDDDTENTTTQELTLSASIPKDSDELIEARHEYLEKENEMSSQDAQGDAFNILEGLKRNIYLLESKRDFYIEGSQQIFSKIPFEFSDGAFIISKYIACADENDMHTVFVVFVKDGHQKQRWNMERWGWILPRSLSKWIATVKGIEI